MAGKGKFNGHIEFQTCRGLIYQARGLDKSDPYSVSGSDKSDPYSVSSLL